MMELSLFIILNILGAIFTILIIAFKQLPDERGDDAGGWQGISFIASIIAVIIWIILAVSSINLGYTQPYTAIDNTTLITGSYEIVYPNTWPFALIYSLISILPFVLIFFLWPETWRKNKGE